MKYFSTFSGIGGFELGIETAFKELHGNHLVGKCWRAKTKGHELPECVGFSEIDKYAIQIYQNHFDHKAYGNIKTINTDDLPDFDLLCGGFPCQAFSIAGKRGGFDDTRGTLFFELARIARAKRPRLLFFENVKGLLSHDGGRTFDTIIRAIDELGYDCQWQVLNSKNFGVPQNRERVFIIGHLRGTARPKVFPIREDSQADIVLPTLTSRYYGGQANGGYIDNKPKQIRQLNQPKHSNNRLYGDDGIAPALNTAQGGNRQPKVAVRTVHTEETKRIRRESMKKGKDWGPRQGYELSARTDNLMNTLTAHPEINQAVWDDMKIRRLTPTECERLQGFPDGWTEGMSDSQRYKCLGNAVTVNVIREIFKRLE